jgi:endonuclease III
MINPAKITNFNRSTPELQAFLLFGICVAGKKSKEIAPKVNAFCAALVDENDEQLTPFEGIRELIRHDMLFDSLVEHKLGKYDLLMQSLWEILYLDLENCTLQDLETTFGIGPKTARFFLLHSRPYQKLVVLDTHLLKYFKGLGWTVPKATPGSLNAYIGIEDKAIKHIETELKESDFAHFDLTKWLSFATV